MSMEQDTDAQQHTSSHISHLPEHLLCTILTSGSLNARDVARCSSVCHSWRHLATHDTAAVRAWRNTYLSRWPQHTINSGLTTWQALYGQKMQDLSSYRGRYQADRLFGHNKGVRCCALLPRYGLMVSGSLDKSVRLWDLQQGLPISSTRAIHKGTVRAVEIDAHAIVSASSDTLIRVWLPEPSVSHLQSTSPLGHKSEHRPVFDLAAPPSTVLTEHTGPVISLSLSDTYLFSGSWDYSVRIWRRDRFPPHLNATKQNAWPCVSVLTYNDWVSDVIDRGPYLCVCAGLEVHIHDVKTAVPVCSFHNQDLILCCEASQNGRYLFTGSDDGSVRVHDVHTEIKRGTRANSSSSCNSRVLWQHAAPVQSLSFEDPWLASVAANGSIALIDTSACSPSNKANRKGEGSSASASIRADNRGGNSSTGVGPDASSSEATGSNRGAAGSGSGRKNGGATVRQLPSLSGCAYSVGLANQWLVCGGADTSIRVYDFKEAHVNAQRAAEAKMARVASKESRQETQALRQQQRLQERQRQQQERQAAIERAQHLAYVQDQQQQGASLEHSGQEGEQRQ